MGQILAIAFVVICIAWLVILGVCAADVVREHGPQGAPTYSFTEIDPHIRTSISPLVRLILLALPLYSSWQFSRRNYGGHPSRLLPPAPATVPAAVTVRARERTRGGPLRDTRRG